MERPFRRQRDEDDEPEEREERPRSPLDLRSGYRGRNEPDDAGGRSVPRREPVGDARPSGLPVRRSSASGRRPDDRKSDDKDSGGRFGGLPFRRGSDSASKKDDPPRRSPFGVRGDDPREDDSSGGRRLPFSRGGGDKPAEKDSGGGRLGGLPLRRSSGKKSGSGRSGGKSDDKDSGGRFGLPFSRGGDKKDKDEPPAFSRRAPSRGASKKDDEKKGRLGGLFGRKDKDDEPDDKSPARSLGGTPRRGPFTGADDDRPGSRSAGSRAPVGGSGDRDRSAFAGPDRDRSRMGAGDAPRRAPFGSLGDDRDDDGPSRSSGLGLNRDAADRSPFGSSRTPSRSRQGGTPDRSGPFGGPRPGADRPAERKSSSGSRSSFLGGRDKKDDVSAAAKPRFGGGLPDAAPRRPSNKSEPKAPPRRSSTKAEQPGAKARRSRSRPLPQTKKAPRIVKNGLDLDRKLDLIGVALVGFALVVFFAVLPSMSFGVLPPVSGGLTGTIDRILSQLFGWGKILWPLASGAIGIWLMLRYFGGQMFDVDYFRVVGALSLYACALTWMHFVQLVNDPAPTVEAFREISRAAAIDQGEGGGWFGHQFYLLLLSQLGDWGAVSVMIAWLIVGLMLTFDVSLVELGQFFAAIFAVFRFSPEQRARKRAARETAEAETVGVTRPGEAAPARPRQMPLAPTTAAVGAGAGSAQTPSGDGGTARSMPLIRRRSSAGEGELVPEGTPSAEGAAAAATPPDPNKPPARPGASVGEAAEGESGRFLSRRRLPHLRRGGDEDTADGAESKAEAKPAGDDPAAEPAESGGGRFGRFLRRRSKPAEDADSAGQDAQRAATDAAGAAPAESASKLPDRLAAARLLARKGSAEAEAEDDETASEGDAAPEVAADSAGDESPAPQGPPRRMGTPFPARGETGEDRPAATASEGERPEPSAAGDEAEPRFPRRTLPGAAPFRSPREPEAGAPDAESGPAPRRPLPGQPPTARADEPAPERAESSSPFRNRPPIRDRSAEGPQRRLPDAPDPAPPAGAPERRTAHRDDQRPAREMTPPVRERAERERGDDEPPARRTVPFGSAPFRRAPEADESEDAPARPARVPSAPDAPRSGRAQEDDDATRPERPPRAADDGDADEVPGRSRSFGGILAGAALTGVALAGTARDKDGDGARDAAPAAEAAEDAEAPAKKAAEEATEKATAYATERDRAERAAPAARLRPPVRPSARDLEDDDADEDDLDDFDDEDEDDEEPLFDQPARPAGLVRPPLRPGATPRTPTPQRSQPRASDAGVRAANEFAARMQHQEEATQPAEQPTEPAPTQPAPAQPQRPASAGSLGNGGDGGAVPARAETPPERAASNGDGGATKPAPAAADQPQAQKPPPRADGNGQKGDHRKDDHRKDDHQKDDQKDERPKADAQKPVSRTVAPKRITWEKPALNKLLKAGAEQRINDEVLLDKARVIEDTLASFGAPGKVVEVNPGPVITQFGVEPDYLVSRSGKKTRVKVSSIARLDADLALALAAKSIRIEAPVPGKGFVGIEVPNDEVAKVSLHDIIESPAFKKVDSKLAIALGLGVDGSPVAADLTVMPHLLIAGTTGSGKSVAVNSIITCLLANNTPDDVQFIMVDPKRVELTGYNGVPHLVAPVVVDLERIVGVLQWVQREMEERYRKFAAVAARNILDYNRKISGERKMPYYVVVIDELADLMMLAPDETERLLARLAQMARATGIHLIISTQRPSVDIITGLIKANFPARIAFAVASTVDSRVILDQPGAEKLLGRGDMLYLSPDAAAPLRMQGVFVSDEEINSITSYWRQQALKHGFTGQPESPNRSVSFNSAPMDGGRGGGALPTRHASGGAQRTFWDDSGGSAFGGDDGDSDEDELYGEAVEMVQNLGKASISLLQRRLRIGYTRAARLIDLMEQEGIIGPAESGSKPREVLKYD